MAATGIRRPDFREVKPTADELADWAKKHPCHRPPYRAIHKDCGKRMWYSGIGIGSHLRACKAFKTDCACGHRQTRHNDGQGGCFDCYPCCQFEAKTETTEG